ncbi:Pycsar system effector family protein [Microlunatus aurantiacus]|uniref:Pycsar system effector family protein n=1 Tax=Microlunatus aurantiacus TaxID=446786 RepID=UPI0031D336A2
MAEKQGAGTPPAADPDQAWRVLGLVNDWLKHAESKAAGALAAAGVVGGVLFALVGDQNDMGWFTAVMSIVCAVAVVATGVCAGLSLWPRINADDPPTSPLYFDHIARQHPDATTYRETLKLFAANNEQIIQELASQVWANAHVSRKKYLWAGWATVALIAALGSLAIVAICLGVEARG